MDIIAKLSVVLITSLVWSAAYSAGQEGSCDASVERTKKTIRFRVGTVTENSDNVRVVPVCGKAEVEIRKCAVIEQRKRDLQFFCFPADGSEQHAERYDIIEYYESKVQ